MKNVSPTVFRSAPGNYWPLGARGREGRNGWVSVPPRFRNCSAAPVAHSLMPPTALALALALILLLKDKVLFSDGVCVGLSLFSTSSHFIANFLRTAIVTESLFGVSSAAEKDRAME